MPTLPLLIVGAAVAAAIVFFFLQPKEPRPRKVPHDYFDRLWLWPSGSHTRWEAEVDLVVPGVEKMVGLHAETTHEDLSTEEPSDAEVAFCQKWLADLDGLFQLAQPAIEGIWSDWVDHAIPADWRADLLLVGLSAPLNGDGDHPWEVSYFCGPAAHYFTVEMRGGKAVSLSVDG